MVPTLLAISLIVFVIIQLPPGDYLETMISELQSQGENVDPAKIEALRQLYGLDRPFHEQYLLWVYGMLQGDLGFSFEYQLPVNQVVGDRMLMTFLLSTTSIIFIYVVSFPIGIYSAVRQYSIGDYVFTFVGFLGLATPNLLLALILLWVMHQYFGISLGGLMDEQYIDQPWSYDKAMSVLQHMIAPAIVIGTSGTAGMIRRLRANLLDELQRQYVVTGRAKGLSPIKLLVKYPLRMAINPFIADIGSLLPAVISGSALVSMVMSLPTTGPMLVDALRSQDMYLAGSFLMFVALLTVIGVFLSDLALAVLDPRIRLEGGATK